MTRVTVVVRAPAVASAVETKPMRISLPAAPFEIPVSDRSETAPRSRPIRDPRVTSTRQDRVLADAARRFSR